MLYRELILRNSK